MKKIKLSFTVLFIIILIFFINFGCKSNKTDNKTYVELDIYSGQPNPTWILPSAIEEDMMSRITKLKSTSKITINPQNLGYRGFIINTQDSESNILKTIKLYKGFIEVSNSTGKMYYEDPQKKIEIWLLSTSVSAQPPVSENLIIQIINEINIE